MKAVGTEISENFLLCYRKVFIYANVTFENARLIFGENHSVRTKVMQLTNTTGAKVHIAGMYLRKRHFSLKRRKLGKMVTLKT